MSRLFFIVEHTVIDFLHAVNIAPIPDLQTSRNIRTKKEIVLIQITFRSGIGDDKQRLQELNDGDDDCAACRNGGVWQ